MLEWLEAHQLPCLFRTVFGIDCPECGMQRAILSLLRGDVIDSVKTWPPLIPLLIFIGMSLLRLAGVKKIKITALKIAGFICLIIILISYLLKLIGLANVGKIVST